MEKMTRQWRGRWR